MYIDPNSDVLLHYVQVCYCTFDTDLYALETKLMPNQPTQNIKTLFFQKLSEAERLSSQYNNIVFSSLQY
jgi:hypothetical protein